MIVGFGIKKKINKKRLEVIKKRAESKNKYDIVFKNPPVNGWSARE